MIMKPNINAAGFQLWNLLTWFMISTLYGCSYYKPVWQSIPSDSAKMALLQREETRTLILHSGYSNYVLVKKVVNPNIYNLSGVLGTVPAEHQLYINDKKMKYKLPSKNDPVLQEMHVYTKLDTAKAAGSDVTIAAKDILRMDLIQVDKIRSQEATWGTVTFAALGVGLLAGIVYLIAISFEGGLFY
jgi:hypothetical protein